MPQLPPGCKYRVRNATHICFELPDQQHVVSIYIYKHVATCHVIHDVSNKYVLDFKIPREHPDFDDLLEAFQEKAIEHFPKPIRHKSVSVARIKVGL